MFGQCIKTVFFVSLILLYRFVFGDQPKGISEVDNWLQEQNLSQYKLLFKEKGVHSLISCAQLSQLPEVSSSDKEKLQKASELLKKQLILRQWLFKHKIEHLYSRLLQVDVASLEDIYFIENVNFMEIDTEDSLRWNEAAQTLPSTEDEVENLKTYLWTEVLLAETQNSDSWSWGVVFFTTILVGALVTIKSYLNAAAKPSLLQYVTGKYILPSNCKVIFEWENPKVVGETLSFTIYFYQRNGQPYPICDTDHLNIEIKQFERKIATNCQLGGCDPNQANIATVKFTVRHSGLYTINIQIDDCHIKGSPFYKIFLPGPPDPRKTQVMKGSPIVVCTASVVHYLTIEPRDEFNNLCNFTNRTYALQGYKAVVCKHESDVKSSAFITFEYNEISKKIVVALNFVTEGCYQAFISLNDVNLNNGDFDIIVLSSADANLVQENVTGKSHEISYEAKLLGVHQENLSKPKKVYCYVSPKQVIVKEFLLKFIPYRLYTFRLCPSTKFCFHGSTDDNSWPTFTIDDGIQPRIKLASNDRNVIAATFSHFLLKNIGGSETFKHKQDFFYHEVRKYHQKHHHDAVYIKIYRDKLLQSSYRATSRFSVSDWCKNFVINFFQEEGVDAGGLSREWFSLICSALFDARNQLFMSFSNNKQALVHPNPKRPSHLKLEHFEFAGKIVGKCLFESALGGKFKKMVNAKFTRSFLAQIIGLRIHYKHFEQDDPDLYLNKIKYIEKNDVDDLDLYFVEEEYLPTGQLVQTIELIPNGSKIRVSNDTKTQYLNSLAQYRLASRVKSEVDHFLKGLNELIPDALLSIFDENELELLLCGVTEYDIADFKANHRVSGHSVEFRRVLDWFWTAVSNFTVEEMARLLQFTTGCSQLPPGGFKELTPQFTIVAAYTYGKMPTAHTCFNQLLLPDYESYEHFEKALLLAIKEGSEGFPLL